MLTDLTRKETYSIQMFDKLIASTRDIGCLRVKCANIFVAENISWLALLECRNLYKQFQPIIKQFIVDLSPTLLLLLSFSIQWNFAQALVKTSKLQPSTTLKTFHKTLNLILSACKW